MYTAEGKIEIDLTEFTEWVLKRMPTGHGEQYLLGVPVVNKANQTLEITYAVGTECHPSDWGVQSEAAKEWKK